MSKQGQYNYKGVNAQAWAAMSLFLQYLRDPNFSHIELEASYFEDFNLVFKDGHKIICESKDHKGNFSYAALKKVLNSIIKHQSIGINDEILIICSNLDKKLQDKVAHTKYWMEVIRPEFQKKGFTKRQLTILPKVKFWEIRQENNHQIVYALFSELLNTWLPQDELECKTDSILIKKIYENSAKGASFKKTDIIKEIDTIKENTKKHSGYFDNERKSVEAQLRDIVKAIDNSGSPVWAPNQLSSISSQPSLMFFVLGRLTEKKIVLRDWKDLWQLNKVYRVSFDLFKIFENNIDTKDNRKYILEFIGGNIKNIRGFYRPHDFFQTDIAKLVGKIIDLDKSFTKEAFEITKILLTNDSDEYFYIRDDKDLDYEKEQICVLLKNIYDKGNKNLQQNIYKFILEYFNLIEDEGDFSHYTPRVIFQIIGSDLISDLNNFEKKFIYLTGKLAEQYDRFYTNKFGKKLRFKGWELIGGVTSFSAGDYHVTDRHFINEILRPGLLKYFEKDRNKAWPFITTNCITQTKQVKKERPDFLNRASIPVVLKQYKEGSTRDSQEAFGILKEFILSRKGIPTKADLIYQTIRADSPDDKKWELVKVSIDQYKIPIDPFVEQITSDLAKKGHTEAMKTLKSWIKNPNYFQKSSFFDQYLIQNIYKLLDAYPKDAIEMLEEFLASDYFINKYNEFDVYEVARLSNTILIKDFDKGLAILNKVNSSKVLSKNQQILLCYSFFNNRDENANDTKFLERIYQKFVNPFLTNLQNSNAKVIERIPVAIARENFLQFATKLIKHKDIEDRIRKALRIVDVFIDDPDPYFPGQDPSDPENQYNEHKRIEEGNDPHIITSVRGECAWTLMNCIVLDGGEYLPKTIKLVGKLLADKNLYVKHMASFALAQLTQARLTVLPDNKSTLFLNDDKKTALIMAKDIEKDAFRFLKDIAAKNNNVKKALGEDIINVFGNIRTLSNDEAMFFLGTVKDKFPDETIGKAIPLFIYFAEFRKDAFKDWKLSAPGLYDDLAPNKFNEKKFKNLLIDLIEKGSSEVKSTIAWNFWKLPKDSPYKFDEFFKLSLKYLNKLSKKYDHAAFERIYYFIDENINQKFDECFNLWINCLKTEKAYLDNIKKKEDLFEKSWWPYHYNGKILVKVKKEKGVENFLEWFEFLSEYREELNPGITDEAVEEFRKAKNNKDQKTQVTDNFLKRGDTRFFEE